MRLLLVLILISVVAFSQNWKLEKNENGINVYSYKNPKTGLPYIKITAVFDISKEKAFAFYQNVDNYKIWYEGVVVSKKLKELSSTKGYSYTESKSPFPYDNRDMPVEYNFVQDTVKKIHTLFFKSAPTIIPEIKGIYRIKNAEGYWKMIEQGKGKMLIEFMMYIEPGSSIPIYFAKKQLLSDGFKTFLNIRKEFSKK